MNLPLMPKATAIWLVENTSLTFKQISEFCGLHIMEIEAIADGEMDMKLAGFDPIISSQLTHDEIKRCEADDNARLILKKSSVTVETKQIARKYTSKAKRNDKPDAIAWIVKYYPNVSENDICNLITTSKATIKSVKNKTHKNSANIKPKSPVSLGLCSESELDFVISKLSRE